MPNNSAGDSEIIKGSVVPAEKSLEAFDTLGSCEERPRILAFENGTDIGLSTLAGIAVKGWFFQTLSLLQ